MKDSGQQAALGLKIHCLLQNANDVSTWQLLGGCRDDSCQCHDQQHCLNPTRAAHYATAESKVTYHLVTVTKRNSSSDGSISHGKCAAWKPALCNDWQHISMTVYLAIC